MKKVVVTTKYKGVFYGEIVEKTEANGEVTVILANAKNCIYWTAATRGFLGLAKHGPGEGCRIGPAVDRLELYGVTSISDCTPEAIKRWEGETWTD